MTSSLNASPRAILRNVASNYITLVLGALLGFVITPILLRRLGTDGFGVWSLVLAVAAYLSLLEAGLGPATTNRVAGTETTGPEAMSRVLCTGLVLGAGIAAVALVVAVGLAGVFPLLFNVPRYLLADARIAVLLIGAAQASSALLLVFTSALLGTGRMHVVNFRGFSVSALTSVAQAVALLSGGSLIALAAIQFVGAVVTVYVFRDAVQRALPEVEISFRRFDTATAKQLFAFGWRNSIYSITGVFAFGSDLVLIGLLLGTRAAAGYAIALKVYTLMQIGCTGVLGALGPAHAHAAHNSTSARRFKIYSLSMYTNLALAFYGAVTVGLFSPILLHLWLGQVPTGATSVLTVFCFILVLQVPGSSSAQLLLSSERASDLMRITLVSAAINIAASIVLTLTVGRIGPALGSLLAASTMDAVYMPRRICQLLSHDYRELIRTVLMPLIVPLGLLLAVLAIGSVVLPSGAWVLVTLLIGAVAYFGAIMLLPTGKRIRLLALGDDLAIADGT